MANLKQKLMEQVAKASKKKRKIGKVDQSFTHSGGKGEMKRIEDTTYEGIDTLGPKDDISIFDLEGRGFVTLPYDRTRAGFALTKVDDVDLKQPVDYHGGQDFMYDTDGLIGASGKGVMTRLLQQAKNVEKYTGKPALFMPNRLQGSGSNFSRQPVETMIQYAASNLGKDGRKELNAIIKTIVPNFKGIGSKDAMTAIRETNDKQKVALQNALHNAFGKRPNMGGLSSGQARALSSDPNQLTATKTGFQNVAEIDTSRGLTPFSGHIDYPWAAHGEPKGQLKEKNLMYYDLMTDKAAENLVKDPRNLVEGQRRSAQMGYAESGVVTEDKLKNLAKLLASGTILTAGSAYADDSQDAMADTGLEQLREGQAKAGLKDYMQRPMSKLSDVNPAREHAAKGEIDRSSRMRQQLFDRLGMKRGSEAFNAINQVIDQVKKDAYLELQQKLYDTGSHPDQLNSHRGPASETMVDLGQALQSKYGMGMLDITGNAIERIGQGEKLSPLELGMAGLESATLPLTAGSAGYLKNAAKVGGFAGTGAGVDVGLTSGLSANTLRSILERMQEEEAMRGR